MRRFKLLFSTGFIIGILLTSNVQAGHTVFEHEFVMTDDAKIHLVLLSIEQAINDPNPIYIAPLEVWFSEKSQADVQELVGYFGNTKEQSFAKNGVTLIQDATFKSKGYGKGDSVRVLDLTIRLHIDKYLFTDERELTFRKVGYDWHVENVEELLLGFNELVDYCRAAVATVTSKEDFVPMPPPPPKATGRQADGMFQTINLYSNHKRFTHVVSQQEFNNQTFGMIGHITPFTWDDWADSFDREYLFISDPGWNRIITSRLHPTQGGISAIGSHGTGASQFRGPQGIAFLDWQWYVADRYNQRVQIFSSSKNGEKAVSSGFLGSGFGWVRDVDAGQFSETQAGIAVLDETLRNVRIFGRYGAEERTLFETNPISMGYSANELSKPTALTYGRNMNTGHKHDQIYVADAGSRRIKTTTTSSVTTRYYSASDYYALPDDAYLVSVTADPYGYIYALDGRGRIFMFSPALVLLATFGSHGTADNELLFPKDIKFLEGWRYSEDEQITPIISGEMFVTEHYGDSTGIRRYRLALDYLDVSTSYYPRCSSLIYSGLGDGISLNWTQAGHSGISTQKVIYQDTLVVSYDTIPIALAGHRKFIYNFYPEDPDGEYRLEVTLDPMYGTGPIQTVSQTIMVDRTPQGGMCPELGVNINSIQVLFPFSNEDTCVSADTSELWIIIPNVDVITGQYPWARLSQIDPLHPIVEFSRNTFTWSDTLVKFIHGDPYLYFRFKDIPNYPFSDGDHLDLFNLNIYPGPFENSGIYSENSLRALDGDNWVFNAPFYREITNSPCYGACCDTITILDGECYIMRHDSCNTIGGIYNGSLSKCPPWLCNSCCDIRGDIDHSGEPADIADLTYFIDYLMRQTGPPPPCTREADVNGSYELDINDLTYLIDYQFRSGPAPVPCPGVIPPTPKQLDIRLDTTNSTNVLEKGVQR